MKKKILALALVVAMLAVAIVSASLAYFTDEDYATNTFTVGEVDIDLQEDFGNTPGENDGIDDTDNTKENFYPGVAVNKDVWVVNTSTTGNDAYVRVHVAFPKVLAPREAIRDVNDVITGYNYKIDGQDGLALVTLYDNHSDKTAYNSLWSWDAEPYFARIGEADKQQDCIVFVATYQKALLAKDNTSTTVDERKTEMDVISAITLNPAVDSDITTDANTNKDELVLFLDINTKNGKFDGADKELWVKAQGDKTPNFTIDIEVAAEAVQTEGFDGKTPAEALNAAFDEPGEYNLSDGTGESTLLWTDCAKITDTNHANP
jgi:predicted ribosomally synthesized peptide with SipW-like signal peptide